MKQTKVEILLNATAFKNKNPKIKIYHNNDLIDDYECVQKISTLTYFISPHENNNLKIEFYNKSFGDNHIWDTDPSIGEDLTVKVLDIKFDSVSIGHLLNSLHFTTRWTPQQLKTQTKEFLDQYTTFTSNGLLSFNGYLEFNWSAPVYDFLIEKKFKKTFNKDLSYFSNNTELFHYEHGKKFLDEIKNLIRDHEL